VLNKRGISEQINNGKLLQYLSDANLKRNRLLARIGAQSIYESVIFDWCIRGSDFGSYFSSAHPWIKSRQYSSHIKYRGRLLVIKFHFELQNARDNNLLRCGLVCDEWPAEISLVNLCQGLYINELGQEFYEGGHLSARQRYCLVLHSIVSADVLMNKVNQLSENNEDSNSNSNSNQEFNLKLMLRFSSAGEVKKSKVL
jgi:hypothetical protein